MFRGDYDSQYPHFTITTISPIKKEGGEKKRKNEGD